MTQAFNLSQLANNLDSTGRLDATDGLVNAVPVANGGTGASTAAAARTNLGVAEAVFSVPSGGIIIWSGAQAAIPSGWFLCNGANGTPDLRDRFVVGAGSSYAVAASGGSKDAIVVSHTHTAIVTDPGHRHFIAAAGAYGSSYPNTTVTNANQAAAQAWGSNSESYIFTGTNNDATISRSSSQTTGISVANSTAGTSGTGANLPPYYALCYIMKS